jgi:hypothetical protein
MTNRQLERLVQSLQEIMRCPHCSAAYSLPGIHYLGQMENMTFLHMRCADCHTPVFASVALANQNGELILEDLVTDDIAVTNSPESSLTAEEMLDLYEPEMNDADLGLDFGFEQRQLDPLAFEQTPVQIPIEQQVSAEEIMAQLNPVCYDDVLDVHEFFGTFTGDFDFVSRSS